MEDCSTQEKVANAASARNSFDFGFNKLLDDYAGLDEKNCAAINALLVDNAALSDENQCLRKRLDDSLAGYEHLVASESELLQQKEDLEKNKRETEISLAEQQERTKDLEANKRTLEAQVATAHDTVARLEQEKVTIQSTNMELVKRLENNILDLELELNEVKGTAKERGESLEQLKAQVKKHEEKEGGWQTERAQHHATAVRSMEEVGRLQLLQYDAEFVAHNFELLRKHQSALIQQLAQKQSLLGDQHAFVERQQSDATELRRTVDLLSMLYGEAAQEVLDLEILRQYQAPGSRMPVKTHTHMLAEAIRTKEAKHAEELANTRCTIQGLELQVTNLRSERDVAIDTERVARGLLEQAGKDIAHTTGARVEALRDREKAIKEATEARQGVRHWERRVSDERVCSLSAKRAQSKLETELKAMKQRLEEMDKSRAEEQAYMATAEKTIADLREQIRSANDALAEQTQKAARAEEASKLVQDIRCSLSRIDASAPAPAPASVHASQQLLSPAPSTERCSIHTTAGTTEVPEAASPPTPVEAPSSAKKPPPTLVWKSEQGVAALPQSPVFTHPFGNPDMERIRKRSMKRKSDDDSAAESTPPTKRPRSYWKGKKPVWAQLAPDRGGSVSKQVA